MINIASDDLLLLSVSVVLTWQTCSIISINNKFTNKVVQVELHHHNISDVLTTNSYNTLPTPLHLS